MSRNNDWIKHSIGKCSNCGVNMLVGTPIGNKTFCYRCYAKYEKDKVSFLEELTDNQKKQIQDLQEQLRLWRK